MSLHYPGKIPNGRTALHGGRTPAGEAEGTGMAGDAAGATGAGAAGKEAAGAGDETGAAWSLMMPSSSVTQSDALG